jgi:hypothetical protein
MRNLFLASTAVVGLTISAITAQAHLGWTLAECKQHYGKLTKAPEAADAGRRIYTFVNKGFRVEVYFPTDDDSASRVVYVRNFPVDLKQIHVLMDANAPDVTWSDPIKDSDGTADHHFVGTVNDQITNYAQVDSLCEIFAIWTVADDTDLTLAKNQDTKDIQAGLGRTLADCQAHWGKSVYRDGENCFDHVKVHNLWMEIRVKAQDGGQETSSNIVSIDYTRNAPIPINVVEKLLFENCPDVQWVHSIMKNQWIAYTPERWATIENLEHDPSLVADFTMSDDARVTADGCALHIDTD